MKKVSIIIPVYNSEKYIAHCFDSILSQTYKNYEVIAINDGSKDKSLSILKEYGKKYPDIFKIIDQKNKGIAKTRNLGIKMSTGEYIMFIDNDDYIDSDYISTFVKEIGNSKSDLVIGGYRRVTDNNKILFSYKLADTNWSKYIVMAPWAKIYNRDFLVKNNIEFLDYGIGEDVYFNISIYSKTSKIKVIDYIGYNWYYNFSSLSNTKQKGFNEKLDITYFLDQIKSLNNTDELLNYYYLRYVIWYLLFSGKTATRESFMNQYNKLFSWLKSNNIKIKTRLFSNKISGESLKNRIIINVFIIFSKLKLISLVARIYCKGANIK